jgi:hypothetical protein
MLEKQRQDAVDFPSQQFSRRKIQSGQIRTIFVRAANDTVRASPGATAMDGSLALSIGGMPRRIFTLLPCSPRRWAGGTPKCASAQSASMIRIKNVVPVSGAFADGSG